MIILKLEWKAMNVLYNQGEVSVSAGGLYVDFRRRRPDYLVRLNADGSHYIFCHYQDRRDHYGEYAADLLWHYCAVRPSEYFWVKKRRHRE